jgi:hypothetical protein
MPKDIHKDLLYNKTTKSTISSHYQKDTKMKLISLLTLTTLLSISACSHHSMHGKSHCGDKTSCSKDDGKKKCCDHKEKKCADGSCEQPKKS